MPLWTMEAPPAEYHLADNNHFTRGRFIQPLYICLHDTVGTDSLAWLTTTPGSNASAHRLIKRDGKNYILVNREDTAWTNGPSEMYTRPGTQRYQNSAYLTIEMEHLHREDPSWPDVQVDMAAWTCAYWWGIYGMLPIIGHWQVQRNKLDPQGFPWSVFWDHLYHRIPPLK